MAAALLGQVGEYAEGQEEWSQYAERVDHFLVANSVTDAGKKRAVFLSLIGPRCYKLLASLVAPEKPGDKTHAQLVETLSKHYDPQPSEILQRFRFHTRFRKGDESVATYVSILRELYSAEMQLPSWNAHRDASRSARLRHQSRRYPA